MISTEEAAAFPESIPDIAITPPLPPERFSAEAICNDPANSAFFDISDIAEEIRTECANSNGFFAEDLPIGQAENEAVPYASNPYWTLGGPVYQSATTTQFQAVYTQWEFGTQIATSCTPSLPPIGTPADGSEHATAVAGMIGSEVEEGGRWNAALAGLVYANEGEVTATPNQQQGHILVKCEGLSRTVKQLEFFVENGARIYNESYRCGNQHSWGRERLRDYYARYFDTMPIRAAANLEEGNSPQTPTNCRAHNMLCVGSKFLNATAMSTTSRFANLSESDREEPDLVAPGDGSQSLEGVFGNNPLASCGTGVCGQPLNKVSGTSFAAPTVTGLVGLAYEQISGLGYERCKMGTWARAMARASAIETRAFATFDESTNTYSGPSVRYSRHDRNSFPNQDEDESHGAGVPNFARMLGWGCYPEEDCGPRNTEDLEATGLTPGDLPPLDRVHPIIGIDHPSTNGVSQVERGFVYESEVGGPLIADAGACGLQPDPEGQHLTCETGRPQGSAVLSRVVATWDSCPGPLEPIDQGNDPVRPATDFNLILETPGGDRYWMSTSFDDTSEGFEFCHTEEGPYRVILVPTVEDYGCPYPPDPSQKGERHVIVEQRFEVREDACPPLEHFATGL